VNKFGLSGKLRAQADHADELAAILVQASKLVSIAKGCHLYLVSKDVLDQNCIWVTEVWDTKEDHDNSLNIQGVRELISHAMPLMAGRPEPVTLEVIGGSGIDLDK
jgi:quinol monooxygenase YgiN